MRAVVFERVGEPLRTVEMPAPEPGDGQVLVRVEACGVCRTDLHVVDGELAKPKLPLVLGHQIVGRVERRGRGVTGLESGTRVGVPWLGWTCGECPMCRNDRENLCPRARFTGYTLDGGFAEYAACDERYAFPIAPGPDAVHAAPLLCAGLIGYRSYRLAGDAQRIGIYGFGAAAHILAQVAVHDGREVYAFTRAGDTAAQEFARDLGAAWAGASEEPPPKPLSAAIVFAPVGALVPLALRAVEPGGTVVCGGIHMSDIPSFPYSLLWEERGIRSVANLTRRDGEEFLDLAPRIPVRVEATTYPLERAEDALDDLRAGRLQGAAVVVP